MEQQAREADHGRREAFRNAFHHGCIVLFWVVVVIISFAILAIAWHYLMPDKWAWLSAGQLHTLQAAMVSPLAVAAIRGIATRNLDTGARNSSANTPPAARH